MKEKKRGRPPVKEAEKKMKVWGYVKKKHKNRAQKQVDKIIKQFNND